MDKAPRGRGIIAGVMIFAALLILAYWVIWFLVDRDLLASLHTDYYYRFENAFPLADVWLGLLLILATVGLLLRRPWGLLAGLLGGGAGIYLAAWMCSSTSKTASIMSRRAATPAARSSRSSSTS